MKTTKPEKMGNKSNQRYLMSLIEDLIKSTSEELSERLNSPLIYSFAISWCLWNYKFLVILFSDASVTTTFNLINTVAFPDKWSILSHGILYPLLSSLTYIFIYPYPAKFIYQFIRYRQKELQQIQQKIEDETPLTKEESRKIRIEATRIKTEAEDTVYNKNIQINQLNQEISELRKLTDKTSPNLINTIGNLDLDDSEHKVLALIGKLDDTATVKNIIKGSSLEKMKVEYCVQSLLERDMIKKDYNSRFEDYVYSLIQDGRKYLLDHGE